MTANELRQNNLQSWNLIQASFFQELNIISDMKKIFSAGKVFSDLVDSLNRIPTFEEFRSAYEND